jgi:hypothetical protein
LLRKDALCKGETSCDRLKACWCEECGFHWEAKDQPDSCPSCGAGARGDESWQKIQIERCYECPLSALEDEMEGGRGQLINRVFRIQNLMDAKLQFGLKDLTAEEAHVLGIISLERPRGLTDEA